MRHNPTKTETEFEQVLYENTAQIMGGIDGEKQRHSDPQSNRDEVDAQRSTTATQRKFHSKSFSLSENRVAANLNMFKQNRELWEKRAELQSQQSLTTPRILTRNRIAPDLVMDLPVSNKDSAVHSSRESLNSGDEITSDARSVDDAPNDDQSKKNTEDMTTAERFATQNQCTLKKNERFSSSVATNDSTDNCKENKSIKSNSSSSGQADKPKAEVKPQESSLLKDFTMTHYSSMLDAQSKIDDPAQSTSSLTTSKDTASIKQPNISKDSQHKSPIPSRNTQKFVSQFADLHLTGGCMSSSSSNTDSGASQQQFSSFKPQVKVKPQILRKPLVLPPTTPEMVRRNQE